MPPVKAVSFYQASRAVTYLGLSPRPPLLDGATIGELVSALNKMGVKPRDLIQILIAIQQAGALHAELEVY